jgi:hypothetical protein
MSVMMAPWLTAMIVAFLIDLGIAKALLFDTECQNCEKGDLT